MAIRIDTRPYSASHGKPPQGRGAWAFDFDGKTVSAPGGEQNFGTARQWAELEAKRLKVDAVSVAP